MFSNGFPEKIIKEKYLKVLSVIGMELYGGSSGYINAYNSQNEWYTLTSGEEICFPYRIYFKDSDLVYSKITDNEEKWIYDCIFSRSCDGYVREKHLINILDSDFPEWCMPYILRLSSEYVVEIIEQIYESMKMRDSTDFQMFCHANPVLLKRAYTRMTGYWNEFYKGCYQKFDSYVGTKLFKECFCPNTNFEKL